MFARTKQKEEKTKHHNRRSRRSLDIFDFITSCYPSYASLHNLASPFQEAFSETYDSSFSLTKAFSMPIKV
jgi:hypothetical protein